MTTMSSASSRCGGIAEPTPHPRSLHLPTTSASASASTSASTAAAPVVACGGAPGSRAQPTATTMREFLRTELLILKLVAAQDKLHADHLRVVYHKNSFLYWANRADRLRELRQLREKQHLMNGAPQMLEEQPPSVQHTNSDTLCAKCEEAILDNYDANMDKLRQLNSVFEQFASHTTGKRPPAEQSGPERNNKKTRVEQRNE
ncbi:hypothetical protein Pelo_6580 [Pelomyxa schiedti]|nr:hypothetical protein Pelo_6580 [Pelomyxa schiedti]